MRRLKLLTLATAALAVTSLELVLVGAHAVARRRTRRPDRAPAGSVAGTSADRDRVHRAAPAVGAA